MQSLSRSLLFLVCFALSSLPTQARAEQTWREVRSPHFRVLTDASENDGRKVAFEFEQMRSVFATLFNNLQIESGAPLTIVAARNVETYRTLEPALWKLQGERIAGEFHRGWEKQFAVIRLDTWGDENQTVVYHEYTHSILHANIQWLPTWLDEGLAEYYAYTRFESSRILVGTSSRRMDALRRNPLIPISTMLTINTASPVYRDERQQQVFYAEAWAMVHLIEFGDGSNSNKLVEFIHKLGEQEPQAKAFQEAFGDPAAFEKRLSQYLNRFTLDAGVLRPDATLDPKTFVARVLTPAQADLELGCFHVGSHDFANGRALISKALELDPKLAAAHEELGFLEFREGQDEDAQREWKQAVALDPTLPRSRFALLMTGKPIPQQTNGELRETQTALRGITQDAPKFAPPFVELALIEWRMSFLRQAYKDARKAEVLEPWRAGYRILTANILLRGQQPALAAQYTRYVAAHWFGPDHDEAVDLWQKIPVANRGEEPAPVLNLPAGSTAVHGALTSLTCSTQPGKINITATVLPAGSPDGSKPLTFTSDGHLQIGFSDTLWWGEDHFSACHHLAGHPVLVAYKPQGADGGELVDLEVRDDLPADVSAAAAAATPGKAAIEQTSSAKAQESREPDVKSQAKAATP